MMQIVYILLNKEGEPANPEEVPSLEVIRSRVVSVEVGEGTITLTMQMLDY
jgi:hypothetical protein